MGFRRTRSSGAVWVGMAMAGWLAASAALAFDGHPIPAPSNPVQRAQAPDGSNARLAVAGRSLGARAEPKPGSRIVAHVDSGAEVIVVDTQAQWAKIEDYQTGHVLGWVNRLLLLNPAQ